jgi:iron(III) transport system permease protein
MPVTGFSRLRITFLLACAALIAAPAVRAAEVNLYSTREAGLLQPVLRAAALLLFIECVKELPATLLLRPLNTETLATFLYGEASRGVYEDGAAGALAIVALGLLPIILLSRSATRPRAIQR